VYVFTESGRYKQCNYSGSKFQGSRFKVRERLRLNGLKILRLGNWHVN